MTRSKRANSIEFHASNRLYKSDDSIDADEIFSSICKGKRLRRIYLVVLREETDGLFEIYGADELRLPFYDGWNFTVVGIGKGRRHTIDMICDIIESMYQETGGFDAYSYFNT